MIATGVMPHVVLLGLSAVSTGVIAGYAWRRNEQSTRWFVAVMTVFTSYSAIQLVGLLIFHEPSRLVLDKTQWIATALVPLFWLLFAAEYTGHDRLLTRRAVRLLSVVPALTIVLAWSNPLHGLMWTHNTLEPVGGLALLDQQFGLWFWVYVTYTYSIILLGAVLFLRLVWLSEQLYFDQSALLLVGAVAPLLASVFTVFDLSVFQNPTLDMTPYAFAVSGVSFGYATFRHRLFDMIPATRQLGRRSAIQDLNDGVIIVDTSQRIIYANPAAATVVESTPEEILGQSVRSLVAPESLNFEPDDAFAEVKRGNAVYEIRSSPVYSRRDDFVGHTLIISNITDRKRRERQLTQRRDELKHLAELNSVLRGVNRALVSATTREEIEQAVCERLAASELYETACMADIPTWSGKSDQWTIVGEDRDPQGLSDAVYQDDDLVAKHSGSEVSTAVSVGQGGWAVVPLVYRRTVYGALGLYSHREFLVDETSREREILTELGLIIGHTINAVENRRLLSDETKIELTFRSVDEHTPLLSAAQQTGSQLELKGIVPDGGQQDIAYVEVAGSPSQTADALAEASPGEVRQIQMEDETGLIEWIVPDHSLLGTFTRHSLDVQQVAVTGDRVECTVEVPSEAEMRRLMNDLTEAFPGTDLVTKQQRDQRQPADSPDTLTGSVTEELTDKQTQALRLAHQAGYFNWPRDSSAKEIAETLDISRPTFQAHLRKAEAALLAELFNAD